MKVTMFVDIGHDSSDDNPKHLLLIKTIVLKKNPKIRTMVFEEKFHFNLMTIIYRKSNQIQLKMYSKQNLKKNIAEISLLKGDKLNLRIR